MGLFKRFFSLGSKKNKKSRQATALNASETGTVLPQEPTTAYEDDRATSRLLRSSSAHFKVVSEFDYSSMPPLPHPINHIATSSSSSLQTTTTIRAPKSSYNVKVHERQKVSTTELPNAGHDSTDNSRSLDTSQILALRSDPSVTTLLNLFDEDGRVSSQAFSNSPPSEGRLQTARNGSTLRQLLGDPSVGDLTWAERCLGECDSISSSPSSPGLQTPHDFDSNFHHLTSVDTHSIGYDSCVDPSQSGIDNLSRASLNVELSMPSIHDQDPGSYASKTALPPAAQVFGFLYANTTPTTTVETGMVEEQHDVTDSSLSGSQSSSTSSPSASTGLDTSVDGNDSEVKNQIDDLPSPSITLDSDYTSASSSHIPPVHLIITAPTPCQKLDNHAHASRIPRRSPRRNRSVDALHSFGIDVNQHSLGYTEDPNITALLEALEFEPITSGSSDPFTPIPTRQRKAKHRTSASLSSLPVLASASRGPLPFAFDKENSPEYLPVTPVRSRARTLVGGGPSPNSSTELSPFGKQLMIDLRHQRMQARALERDRKVREAGTRR